MNQCLTKTQFIEDDEIVDKEDNGQHQEFLIEERNETKETEEDEIEGEVNADEYDSEEEEGEVTTESTSEEESEEENEVSFIENSNRSNSSGREAKRMETSKSKEDVISAEEEELMRKFAIFLEKNGYIRQESAEDPQPSTSKSDKGK